MRAHYLPRRTQLPTSPRWMRRRRRSSSSSSSLAWSRWAAESMAKLHPKLSGSGTEHRAHDHDRGATRRSPGGQQRVRPARFDGAPPRSLCDRALRSRAPPSRGAHLDPGQCRAASMARGRPCESPARRAAQSPARRKPLVTLMGRWAARCPPLWGIAESSLTVALGRSCPPSRSLSGQRTSQKYSEVFPSNALW